MTRDRLSFLAVLLMGFSAAGIAFAEDESKELTWPAEPDVRVDIEIISGRIEIEGWDRDEVGLRVDGGYSSGLEIEAGRKRVSIRSPGLGRRHFPWSGGGMDVDVLVSVPVQSRIEAKIVDGEIRAEGVAGVLDFHAANGQIEVRGRPREASLETINSSITFEGEGEGEGVESRVDARTINGSIDLRGVASEVSASTMSGSIKVEAGTLERIELKTLSGSIELDARLAPRARAHLKSFSGSIKLELPSDTSARFDLQSFSGGIRNELVTAASASTRRAGGQNLEFTAGEGSGRVTIESFSGSVEIEVND